MTAAQSDRLSRRQLFHRPAVVIHGLLPDHPGHPEAGAFGVDQDVFHHVVEGLVGGEGPVRVAGQDVERHHMVADDLIQQHLQIRLLVEAALDQQHPVLRQKGESLFHPVFQEHQPGAAGEAIIVSEAVGPGVIGHVPVGHPDLSGIPAAEG